MSEPKKPVREWDRLLLRVPDGMKSELEEIAAENCRPLNGQLIFMLKGALAALKTASQPTA